MPLLFSPLDNRKPACAENFRIKRTIIYFVLFVFSITLFTSCNFEKITRKSVEGTVQGLSNKRPQLDSLIEDLSGKLARSISNALLSDSIQDSLKSKISAILLLLNDSVQSSIRQLRRDQLAPLFIDLRSNLDSMTSDVRKKFIGEYTSLWLKRMLSESMDTVLLKLDRAGADFLGEKTRILLDTLFDRVFSDIDKGYNAHLKGNVNTIFNRADESVNNVSSQVNELSKKLRTRMIAFAIIATALLLILIYFYFKAKKHRQTLEVVTRQIDKIPDQQVYDKLVSEIKKNAENLKLEKNLQSVLKSENLYEQEKWKDKDRAVLSLMAREINKTPASEKENVLKRIAEEADKTGLKSHLESVFTKNKN